MITKKFLLAGRAIFTVSNPEGKYYTFNVMKSKPSGQFNKPAWFISTLTGSDNENDYTYMGMLTESGIVLTKKSTLLKDSTLYRVANWAVNGILNGGSLPNGYKIEHSGACGRCGRTLTIPRSIELGLGPVCEGLV